MPRDTSPEFRAESSSLYGKQPVEAVEITVPMYAGSPNKTLRLVNDPQDIVINGVEYIASNFGLELPNDRDGELPTAKLVFYAVNDEISKLIETTHGADGAQVRLILTRRESPVPEYDVTMRFYNISETAFGISGDLGFRNLRRRSSLNMRYEHRTAAGLY